MSAWIAVTDSLPDDDTTVLAYAPDGFDPVFTGFHEGTIWRDTNGEVFSAGYVTHWMPFPEPPSC